MFDPVSYHVSELLNDGSKVEIRAQRSEDREALLAAVGRVSAESFYRRFFGVKRDFSEQELHFFLDIDYVSHVALVAEAIEDGRTVIVGGGRYIVVEPARAELAFTVIDAYQKKGIGTALMRRLAAIGREAGLEELVAEVLADNTPMMKVFERSGLAMTTKREGTVLCVSLRYAAEKPSSEAKRPPGARSPG